MNVATITSQISITTSRLSWKKPLQNIGRILNKLTGFKFYPNPATRKITIETNNNTGKSENEIIDIQGKVWLKSRVLNEKSTIEVAHLPAGFYLLKVMNENKTETVKFVKN